MTNTDKAIVFSNKFKCITIGERCKNIEDACYKMAEWKERQMIEKAVEWMENNIHNYYDGDSEFAVCNWLKRDEFINSFKKAMEG